MSCNFHEHVRVLMHDCACGTLSPRSDSGTQGLKRNRQVTRGHRTRPAWPRHSTRHTTFDSRVVSRNAVLWDMRHA